MKEIIAVIRPSKWEATKKRLDALGVSGVTSHRVYGRGKQRGLRYLTANPVAAPGIRYISKRLVRVMVADADVAPAIEAIQAANRTPAMGDGQIFVCPIESVMRIRTGETDEEALK